MARTYRKDKKKSEKKTRPVKKVRIRNASDAKEFHRLYEEGQD
jgi:hypothetical protein